MNSAFRRYMVILILLFIIWGKYFVWSGFLNQIALNFAIFYPLGFWVGYRSQFENVRVAYATAFAFNILNYLLVIYLGVRIEDWATVVLDFVSVGFLIKIGLIMGRRTQEL